MQSRIRASKTTLAAAACGVFFGCQGERETAPLPEWRGVPIVASWINTADQDDYFACMVERPVAEFEAWYLDVLRNAGWTVEGRSPLNPGPPPGGTRFARRARRNGESIDLLFYDSVLRTGFVIDRASGG